MALLLILWVAVSTCTLLLALIWRLLQYFRDPKGLRKYRNMSPLSGLTNLPFMAVAHTGLRSQYLRKCHLKHPIIRIGSNHLSFGDPRAIKHIYGHGTKASKDSLYEVTAATHMHLAGVVDKSEHARKRKVLSSAYALKNLEEWEHKVADKVDRLCKQFDQRCTVPLAQGQKIPDLFELTVNYRMWINFFTVEAIADIGLSEKLGFLDRGDDMCVARRADGSAYAAPFIDSLYLDARKQSLLAHSYNYYRILDQLTSCLPGIYGAGSCARQDWDAIVLQRTHNGLDSYQRGEKFDDFFQALMEDKMGSPITCSGERTTPRSI